MSILPSQINRGSSSSDSSPFVPRNPSNHGFLRQQRPRQQSHGSSVSPLSPAGGIRALDSLRISDSEASASTADANSGSMGKATQSDFSGSSKEVMGLERSKAKNQSSHVSAAEKVERPCVPTGQDGLAQATGGLVSGPIGSPPNHRMTGSARRRAQMVNGNHLLNFQYDPISRSQPRVGSAPSKKLRGPQKVKAFDRDLFVQANYKFVALDSGDYDLDYMDPDKLLQWEDIICVKYLTPYPVQCPICLETPLCPQITSCGHIFCFPCILQYLLIGEVNLKRECWKKCPLCFMMISSRELYTIYIKNVKHFQVGDTLEFTLLTREKDSFALHPKNHQGTDAVSSHQFSKFILTSDVELSVREAMSDLDSWFAKAEAGLVDDLEKLPYVCAAMEQLKKRKKYWNEQWISRGRKERKNSGRQLLKGENARLANNATELENMTCSGGTLVNFKDDIKQDIDEARSAVLTSKIDKAVDGQAYTLPSSCKESKILEVQSCGSRSAKGNDFYNLYQVVDGQNIILHPLNMKFLLHHYGSPELLPPRVTGRVLELETVTQSDAIRKRFRYLSHFPLTSTFQLCEIDLSGTFPADSLSPFIDQIEKRESRRKQLAIKEQRDKIKAEAVTVYYAPASSFGRSLHHNELALSMDDFEALGSGGAASRIPAVYEDRNLFSNVARLGFAAGHDSPSLNAKEPSAGLNMEQTSTSTIPAGSAKQEATSFANVIRNAAKVNEPKKGRKAGRVLLSTTSVRRY